MLLYVAGPYRGDIEANIRKARTVAIAIWREGHYALCPHTNTARMEQDAGVSEGHFMAGDLVMLSKCDGMVLVPGWYNSEGTKAEVKFATERGIPIWIYPNLPPKDRE